MGGTGDRERPPGKLNAAMMEPWFDFGVMPVIRSHRSA